MQACSYTSWDGAARHGRITAETTNGHYVIQHYTALRNVRDDYFLSFGQLQLVAKHEVSVFAACVQCGQPQGKCWCFPEHERSLMTEETRVLVRKFGVERPDFRTICFECGQDYGHHAGSHCPPGFPTIKRREVFVPATCSKELKGSIEDLAKAVLKFDINRDGPDQIKAIDLRLYGAPILARKLLELLKAAG